VDELGASGAIAATGAGMSVWAGLLVLHLGKQEGLDLFRAVLIPVIIVFLCSAVFYTLKSYGSWMALPVSLSVLVFGSLKLRVFSIEDIKLLIPVKDKNL
jgi:hypothetical protein